ncbi:hypothetical protein BGX20_004806, partial [Mortierella sp. AD010]
MTSDCIGSKKHLHSSYLVDEVDMELLEDTDSESDIEKETDCIQEGSTELEYSSPGRSCTPPPQVPDVATNANFGDSAFWNMIGMPSTWINERGINISASFEQTKSSISEASPNITLCQDNIADFCHDGDLQDAMDDEAFCAALDALPRMPQLPEDQLATLHSVFGSEILDWIRQPVTRSGSKVRIEYGSRGRSDL